jgi:hypothetical protein
MNKITKAGQQILDANHHVAYIENRWRNWPYKNTTFLALSMVVFIYLATTPVLDTVIAEIGELGYLGAFLVGIFFVSTFTVAPAALILFRLAESLTAWEVAVLAGLGAVVGDFIIFRFLRDKVFVELRPLFLKFGRPYIKILFRSPHFAWLLPFFGAFIIASPLPDEVGVGLMGLSRIKQWQFFFVALGLNIAGIFLTVSAARLF